MVIDAYNNSLERNKYVQHIVQDVLGNICAVVGEKKSPQYINMTYMAFLQLTINENAHITSL